MVKLIKKIIFKFYVIFLMAFTVWYGSFMYPLIFGFEGKEKAEESLKEMGHAGTDKEQMFVKLIAEQAQTRKTDLGYRVIDQPYIEGRFHNIGISVKPDKASICVRCHGNVPHDHSKEIRSFLNMHAFYLACETCHIQPEKGKPAWKFRWYSKKTGKVVPNPKALVEIEDSYKTAESMRKYPMYGNYGAKIAPGKMVNGKFRFLHTQKDMAFVNRYIAEQDHLGPEQKSQMKRVIHEAVNKKPLMCDHCHQEKAPYIPFAKLGYPPRRVDELTDTSVVGMIRKYKEFYIPNFLTPGVTSSERAAAQHQ